MDSSPASTMFSPPSPGSHHDYRVYRSRNTATTASAGAGKPHHRNGHIYRRLYIHAMISASPSWLPEMESQQAIKHQSCYV